MSLEMSDPVQNTIVDIYSLFLNIIILCFYLSFYHHVILIAFKNKTKNKKKTDLFKIQASY